VNAALSSNANSAKVARIQRYHLKNRDRSVSSTLRSFAKQRIMVNVRDLILVAMGIIVGGVVTTICWRW